MQTADNSQALEEVDEEKTGGSSKWDHHLTLALIIALISALFLNPFAFGFGLGAIYFAYKVG